MTINQRLNAYLIENGIKQRYLAKKTGISDDRISKIMSGGRKLLATEFLDICAALGLDPRDFQNPAA